MEIDDLILVITSKIRPIYTKWLNIRQISLNPTFVGKSDALQTLEIYHSCYYPRVMILSYYWSQGRWLPKRYHRQADRSIHRCNYLIVITSVITLTGVNPSELSSVITWHLSLSRLPDSYCWCVTVIIGVVTREWLPVWLPVHDLSSHRSDRLVRVRPNIDIFDLATLTREAHEQCQVLPPAGTVTNKKRWCVINASHNKLIDR